MERSPQIQPHHLEKLALIWVRQSTMERGRNNMGSADGQQGLRERAHVWGWPEFRIRIIDEVGVSGSTGLRHEFQHALDLMDRDEVAIVFFNDASRLSRNPLDAQAFLVRAMAHGVLVEISGKLYAPGDADLSELFGLRIQNLLTLLRKIDERPAAPSAGGNEPRVSAPAGEAGASGRHGESAHDEKPPITGGAGTEPPTLGEKPSGQEPAISPKTARRSNNERTPTEE